MGDSTEGVIEAAQIAQSRQRRGAREKEWSDRGRGTEKPKRENEKKKEAESKTGSKMCKAPEGRPSPLDCLLSLFSPLFSPACVNAWPASEVLRSCQAEVDGQEQGGRGGAGG